MASQEDKSSGEVFHGTINVVLANRNGIVALTDSMVTAGRKQLHDQPAQKLFKLDDRTVCTIAGFLSAPGPCDLYMASSALVHDYAQQLSSKPQQTIREKLTSLAFLFEFQLSAISTVRALAGWPRPLQSELTVAGYDTDGIAKIGQIELRTVASGNSFKSEIRERSITDVGESLVSKLAGVREVGERLLRNPDSAKDDPVLAAYARSLRENQGQSLTIPEMKAVAARLLEYTAQECPSVGGENQIADLQDGHVLTLEQPTFAPVPKALIAFCLVVDSNIAGTDPPMVPPMSEGTIIFPAGNTLLFLRTKFEHVFRRLDGNYFFQDTFNNCRLQYDGGPLYFDSDNQVTGTSLALGPNVSFNEPQVQNLLNNFQWFGVSKLTGSCST